MPGAASQVSAPQTRLPLQSAGRRAASGGCRASRRRAGSRPLARSSAAQDASWSAVLGCTQRCPNAHPAPACDLQGAHNGRTLPLAKHQRQPSGISKRTPPAQSARAGCPAGLRWTGSPAAGRGRSCRSPPALQLEGRQTMGMSCQLCHNFGSTVDPIPLHHPPATAVSVHQLLLPSPAAAAHPAPGCPPCRLGSR